MDYLEIEKVIGREILQRFIWQMEQRTSLSLVPEMQS